MVYNNDIQYKNERTNRTRMFMSHPCDFSKTSMIQSLYLVRSPYRYRKFLIILGLRGLAVEAIVQKNCLSNCEVHKITPLPINVTGLQALWTENFKELVIISVDI